MNASNPQLIRDRINNVQHSIDTANREASFEKRRSFSSEKEYALNRKAWKENPLQHIVSSYPLHVDLELSSVCNLNCQMCYTVTDEFISTVNPGFMDINLFKKIVQECAENQVYSIRLSLRGESLLHKQFTDCIRYAKEKGIKEVSCLTNGSRLTDKHFAREIVDAGLDWITISIDGVGAVYEKIRAPMTFDGITRAVKHLMEYREKKRAMKPAIKIQGVWPAVKVDLDAYIQTFMPLADLIYTNPLVDYLNKDALDQIEYLPDFTCYQLFQRLVVSSDGKVLMCANDQMGEEIIGDASTHRIHEIWHGEKMAHARRVHADHHYARHYPICRKCQLPRSRTVENVFVNNRQVIIENYKNRCQTIGK